MQEMAPQAPSHTSTVTNARTVTGTGTGTFVYNYRSNSNNDLNNTRELFAQMGIVDTRMRIADDEEYARKTEQEFRDEALAMELQRKEQLHRNAAPLRGARGRGVAPVDGAHAVTSQNRRCL